MDSLLYKKKLSPFRYPGEGRVALDNGFTLLRQCKMDAVLERTEAVVSREVDTRFGYRHASMRRNAC